MKRTIIAFIFSCFALIATSQDRSAFISLQTGPSVPVGKYQAQELEKPAGSFATTGISVSLEGAWFFKPWLGVGGQFGMHFHPVDVSTLGYYKVIEDPFMNDVYIRSDPYRNYALYAGLYFEQPVIQRLSVTAKALGGVLLSKTPYQLYKAEYEMAGLQYYEITTSGDLEGSFMAGTGLKYSLKNCIGFTLNGEFTYNQCDFDFEKLDGSIRTDQKVIAFVNILAGIFLKL